MKIIFIFLLIPQLCLAEEFNKELEKRVIEFEKKLGMDKVKSTMIDGYEIESRVTSLMDFDQESGKLKFLDQKAKILDISKTGLPPIAIGQNQDKTNRYSVSIFNPDSGEPNITIHDRNGDGVMDHL